MPTHSWTGVSPKSAHQVGGHLQGAPPIVSHRETAPGRAPALHRPARSRRTSLDLVPSATVQFVQPSARADTERS